MSRSNIIRAWKDEEYRQSLSVAEREAMPPNPAGLPELSDAQLKQAAGGGTIIPPHASPQCSNTCNAYTFCYMC
jgi:mersacidin/lichenicidin family type 2 lantibiotic